MKTIVNTNRMLVPRTRHNKTFAECTFKTDTQYTAPDFSEHIGGVQIHCRIMVEDSSEDLECKSDVWMTIEDAKRHRADLDAAIVAAEAMEKEFIKPGVK